uniref:Uncharacterized protein n=1 Tax=Arion vulgaris TaxID=1028688 RepID=A0A0B7BIY9_9EUPU
MSHRLSVSRSSPNWYRLQQKHLSKRLLTKFCPLSSIQVRVHFDNSPQSSCQTLPVCTCLTISETFDKMSLSITVLYHIVAGRSFDD